MHPVCNNYSVFLWHQKPAAKTGVAAKNGTVVAKKPVSSDSSDSSDDDSDEVEVSIICRCWCIYS